MECPRILADLGALCYNPNKEGEMMAEYSDLFCKVYNVFGWNYYPEIFGEQLLGWLTDKGLLPKTAMDLACGTGVLCRILDRQGIATEGMDFSPGMIKIAKESGGNIAYQVADMITFRPKRQYDLVTCTGDAINHIHDLADVEKIFQNVYAYTAPGGWFVFDLLNEREVSDSEPFEMEYDENTRVWFQMRRREDDRVNLKIRVFAQEKLQFEENIYEQLHDPKEICRLLEKCGFRQVRCADRLRETARPGTTWFITATK